MLKLRRFKPLLGGRRRRKRHGGNAWDDFSGFFTRTIPSAARSAYNYVRNNNVISDLASNIPIVGNIARTGLRHLGVGRRRKRVRRVRVIRRRRRIGGDAKPVSRLAQLNKYLKETKLVSKGLHALGFPKLSSVASVYGYGRRRKRRVGRPRVRKVRRIRRRRAQGGVRRRRVGRGSIAGYLPSVAQPNWRPMNLY